MATIPLCSLCLDNGGNCLACHEWKKAIAIKDSQLAESAAREVQLMAVAKAVRSFFDLEFRDGTYTQDELIAMLTITIEIEKLDALAAPPSTAAAELVALRELEQPAHMAASELEIAIEWVRNRGEQPRHLIDSVIAEMRRRTKACKDALAAVAAARAGTP